MHITGIVLQEVSIHWSIALSTAFFVCSMKNSHTACDESENEAIGQFVFFFMFWNDSPFSTAGLALFAEKTKHG